MSNTYSSNNQYQLALEEILAELNIRRYKEDFWVGISLIGEKYHTRQKELHIQQRDTLDWLINYVSALHECAGLTKKVGDTFD